MLKHHTFRLSAAVMMFLSFGIVSASQPMAQTADGFKHREISLLIPSGPGGGYDRYARLLARHITKHLPGQPTVVPKNMPGAGGIVLANFMHSKAPRDGSVIAGMQNERILDPILGMKNANYKSSAFTWLGSINQITNVCVAWHATGIRSAAELRDKELVVGVASTTSTERVAQLVNEMVGTKLKLVQGYPGTTEIQLAMDRGEVSGACGLGWDSLKSGRPDWIAQKKVNIILQMGATPLAELKDAPFMHDLLLKQEERPVLDFLVGRMYLGRPFIGPPEMAPSAIKIFRDAFWATMQDRDFIAEADKLKVPVLPVAGADAQQHVLKLENTPPAVIQKARSLL